MTGGYRPWSKFNAHSWSLLNARRQVTTEGDFGGEMLRSHWEFFGGIGGTIKRDVEWSEGDIEAGYERTLVKDDVEEIDAPSV